MSGSILIVEDEDDIARSLEYNLQREGFATVRAGDGRRALEVLRAEPAPDLVLLDLMLPDMSGTEVCRLMRATDRLRHIPVLMLSARGEEIDRVVGFEVGADDYVSKPFSVRELMLRLRAILRRTHPPEVESGEVIFGRLRVDREGHRAWVDRREVVLTALEFRLLMTLLNRRGRVQTRYTLLEDVWEMSGEVTTRTVDTHVKRLRQKLGDAGEYIETLRGVGYRFRARAEQA
jgi:two-component system phosphate regulon response regulator PhoB